MDKKKMNSNYLVHYGTKGMHWYERQYQNPDGTWTELGKERRRIGNGTYGSSRAEVKAIKKTAKKYMKAENKSAKKQRGKRSMADLPRKTIPVGTKFYRVSVPDENLSKNHGIYVMSNTYDRYNAESIGPFIAKKRGVGLTDLAEHEYETTSDIKVASMQDSLDVMKQMVMEDDKYSFIAASTIISEYYKWDSDDMPTVEETRDEYASRLRDTVTKFAAEQDGSEEKKEFFINSITTKYTDVLYDGSKKVQEAIKAIGNNEMSVDEAQVDVYANLGMKAINNYFAADMEYRDKVIKELQNRGFDAMYDDNMINSTNTFPAEAYEPLVIFNNSDITETKSSDLSISSMMDSARLSDWWMRRANS